MKAFASQKSPIFPRFLWTQFLQHKHTEEQIENPFNLTSPQATRRRREFSIYTWNRLSRDNEYICVLCSSPIRWKSHWESQLSSPKFGKICNSSMVSKTCFVILMLYLPCKPLKPLNLCRILMICLLHFHALFF